MKDSSEADWTIIRDGARPFNRKLPDRVLAHLELLRSDYGGFPVSRLEHSLQTATRAYRDNKDDPYIFCALLHDIGDVLASFNHPALAAAIVGPFVDESLRWMVAHHGIFQGYFYFHHVGLNREEREKYRDHPYFDLCEEFCESYDGAAFDKSYVSLSLAEFEPLLRRMMARPTSSS